MRPAILYVHGIGNKPPAELLRRQWDEALFGRAMGTTSRMAYWAPLRYPKPLSGPALAGIEAEAGTEAEAGVGPPLGDTALEAAVSPSYVPPEVFVADVLAEAHGEAGAGYRELRGAHPGPALEGTAPAGTGSPDAPLEGWLRAMAYCADALGAGEPTAGPSALASPPPAATAPGLEVLPLPRGGRTAVFRLLAAHTFKDVHAYFFQPVREQIRDVVRQALAGTSGPVVVVGHSLGSVIAYDVLREAGREVPLFVTIGSPLGITEIQDQLGRPLRVPAGVAAWRNASDARDLVALNHTVRPLFAPSELTSDCYVVNDSANHHGAGQYLASVPVRDAVRAYVQDDQDDQDIPDAQDSQE